MLWVLLMVLIWVFWALMVRVVWMLLIHHMWMICVGFLRRFTLCWGIWDDLKGEGEICIYE